METKIAKVGGQDWLLAQLTYGQVQAIMEGNTEMIELLKAEDPKSGEKAVELRDRTIVWSLNNAHKWPDKLDRFGSESSPYSITEVKSMLPFPSWGECMNELHIEVLKLNKLVVAKDAGEPEAATEAQSTGAVSAVS